MELLVVGAGAMGRWFGTALVESAVESIDLAFLDADSDAASEAARETSGSAVSTVDPDSFDVVCIAVPIPAATAAIDAHAHAASDAVVDVTGTMTAPVEAMREHAPDCERVSFHPLFAPANEPGNVPLVVDESGPQTDAIRDALARRDNTLFQTTPAEHDEAMETVQAKTHAAVLAFALAAEDVPDVYQTPISETLFDLAEQVTDGDPRVYADIQTAFDGADEIAAAAEHIADADSESFEQLFEQAGQ